MPAHLFPAPSDDFCLIHGREHMRSRMGDPISFCMACEEISDSALAEAEQIIPPIKILKEGEI